MHRTMDNDHSLVRDNNVLVEVERPRMSLLSFRAVVVVVKHVTAVCAGGFLANAWQTLVCELLWKRLVPIGSADPSGMRHIVVDTRYILQWAVCAILTVLLSVAALAACETIPRVAFEMATSIHRRVGRPTNTSSSNATVTKVPKTTLSSGGCHQWGALLFLGAAWTLSSRALALVASPTTTKGHLLCATVALILSVVIMRWGYQYDNLQPYYPHPVVPLSTSMHAVLGNVDQIVGTDGGQRQDRLVVPRTSAAATPVAVDVTNTTRCNNTEQVV